MTQVTNLHAGKRRVGSLIHVSAEDGMDLVKSLVGEMKLAIDTLTANDEKACYTLKKGFPDPWDQLKLLPLPPLKGATAKNASDTCDWHRVVVCEEEQPPMEFSPQWRVRFATDDLPH